MRNFKNNHRRNRFRKNGSKQIHQKDNGHKSMADFSTNFNYRPRNQWKNNQNASKLIEKYTNLAREALSTGDKILSESYFQHADHFVRILSQKEIIKDNASNEKGKIQKEELEEIKEQSLTDN
tara:strand:+ start:1146 stop:1514 length:369 start_codon:yes stop_codon:yes gene_type:complete